MPVNRKYPLAVLLEACAYYAQRKKQRLTFEYILIDGVNDTAGTGARAGGARAQTRREGEPHPLQHRRRTALGASVECAAGRLSGHVRRAGVVVTIRREKGHDIDAACGQLRLQTQRDLGNAVASVASEP